MYLEDNNESIIKKFVKKYKLIYRRKLDSLIIFP